MLSHSLNFQLAMKQVYTQGMKLSFMFGSVSSISAICPLKNDMSLYPKKYCDKGVLREISRNT